MAPNKKKKKKLTNLQQLDTSAIVPMIRLVMNTLYLYLEPRRPLVRRGRGSSFTRGPPG
jgi:hypothetical protein